MTAAQKAEFEKKKKDAEAAMAKQKDLNDAFTAGREAEDAKNWDTAIEQYKKAAGIDPKQHVVLSHMADCYIKLGDTKSGGEQDSRLRLSGRQLQDGPGAEPGRSGVPQQLCAGAR